MADPLEIRKVSKSFGNVDILHEVDIQVSEGEFLVLVGPSGCGKSTLLNMIAGLEEISSGEILIRDNVMNDIHPAKRNIAMVFQSYALYPNMNVAENITFGLEMHGVPKPEREKALKKVSAMLQIEQLLKRKPSQLSGGQRQRVAMGRALVREPEVFLFDEPLSNLDAKLRVDMRTEIKKLHQNLGATIVYVTHDQIEAMTLSTKIAVMNEGKVQQLGTAKEIYDRPNNLFVATFMGSPSMNLIEVKVQKSGDNVLCVVFAGDDGTSRTLNLGAGHELDSYVDKTLIMGIRPEAISESENADSEAKNIQLLENKVAVIEPTGSDTYVATNLAGKDCIARLAADANIEVGSNYRFSVNMDKSVFFDPATTNIIPN